MRHSIIQSESDDPSTDDVLSWVYYVKKNAVVDTLFDAYPVNSIRLEMSNKENLQATINDINLDNETNYWYRRGQLVSYFDTVRNGNTYQKKMYEETILPIQEYLNGSIYKNQLNRFQDNFTNKLDMLHLAMSLHINIPDVLVTDNSDDLATFLSSHKKVITKPIKNPFIDYSTKIYNVKFLTHTKLITIDDIPKEAFSFMPSFFQKYIEKKYEIRSFYMDGVFKSMAIFSQQNEKTKTDYRNYDRQRPNRCIPYTLPKSLESKLHQLMIKLQLNSGSFDIICTPENEYYFLEVNPIGQFQWVSKNCNYYIERMIAEKITRHE